MKIYTVDAFTSEPFRGNPAAVCLLEGERPDVWMQELAAEMNLSETAFVGAPDAAGARPLRWFTPAVEVVLCGHATLATAHILWEADVAREETLRFTTLSGELSAKRTGELIELDFPSQPPTETPAPPGLAEVLGVTPLWTGRNARDWVIEIDSESELSRLAPDPKELEEIEPGGVIVTARSTTGEYDFASRFFAPGLGVDEDPVTGSAHTALAPYWGDRLEKTRLSAFQASSRGGFLQLEVRGSRVALGGHAITVLAGELRV